MCFTGYAPSCEVLVDFFFGELTINNGVVGEVALAVVSSNFSHSDNVLDVVSFLKPTNTLHSRMCARCMVVREFL